MRLVSPIRTRCPVCGFAEVRADEVDDGGTLFLAECPRCDHRWTSRTPMAAPRASAPRMSLVRHRLRTHGEGASAA